MSVTNRGNGSRYDRVKTAIWTSSGPPSDGAGKCRPVIRNVLDPGPWSGLTSTVHDFGAAVAVPGRTPAKTSTMRNARMNRIVVVLSRERGGPGRRNGSVIWLR